MQNRNLNSKIYLPPPPNHLAGQAIIINFSNQKIFVQNLKKI